MRIIGLDIHRAFAEAVAWEDGKLRRLGRVDMRRNFLAAFAATLSREDIGVVEATGNAAAVASVIGSHVKRVVIANPMRVRMIAHAKIKTDTIDAGVLAPVDPIFFLHHSNMDRLWDVWTRKQKRLNLPYLPTGQDFETLSEEPFLFYIDGKGTYVGPSKAGDYLSTDAFDYDYEPGFGEAVVQPPSAALAAEKAAPLVKGAVKDNIGSVVVPRATIQSYLADTSRRPLMAQVTLPRPPGMSTEREFDVLVNAPPGVTQVSADNPYYAGTIAFFGPMMPGMKMSADATFAVPLPKTLRAFTELGATKNATLNIRVVSSHGQGGPAPALGAVSVGAL
ncbi:MAG: tyrosinase family protein [Methylocella sp.]